MKNYLNTCVLLLAFLVPAASFAATDDDPLLVTADVAANCTITGATLAFGAYDATTNGATVDATADLTLNCTTAEVVSITMDQGASPAGGSSAAVPARQMASGANLLAYNLSDTLGGTEWGNPGVPYTGIGADELVTVYGNIPAGQLVPIGAYSDSVLVTVTF